MIMNKKPLFDEIEDFTSQRAALDDRQQDKVIVTGQLGRLVMQRRGFNLQYHLVIQAVHILVDPGLPTEHRVYYDHLNIFESTFAVNRELHLGDNLQFTADVHQYLRSPALGSQRLAVVANAVHNLRALRILKAAPVA